VRAITLVVAVFGSVGCCALLFLLATAIKAPTVALALDRPASAEADLWRLLAVVDDCLASRTMRTIGSRWIHLLHRRL
jgi:hypothetical protein